METNKVETGKTEEPRTLECMQAQAKTALLCILALIAGYLWLTRYEFVVVPPGRGEYGVLVRIHRYAGTAEFTFPYARNWFPVSDERPTSGPAPVSTPAPQTPSPQGL